MKGVINNYRRSVKTTYDNQMIIIVEGVTKRADAEKLVGKKIVYNTGKKDITGKVASAHGNKGAIRVIFEVGMPGQAIGKPVIVE